MREFFMNMDPNIWLNSVAVVALAIIVLGCAWEMRKTVFRGGKSRARR